jgi:PilZ domain
MEDRRRSERKSLSTEVECHTTFGFIKARITNIGTRGVFIETDAPPAVGSHLKLVFELGEGGRIEAQGVVAHRESGRGMGVAFVSISAQDLNRIRSHVEAV